MPQFIETEDGYINLNYVVSLRRLPPRRGERYAESHMLLTYESEGSTRTAKSLRTAGHVERELQELVPAHPGAYIWLTHYPESDADGRPVSIDAVKMPVVAWLVNRFGYGGTITPMGFDGEVYDEEAYLMPLDGDMVDTVGNGWHDNIETAKAKLLAEAQESFDRRQAKEAAA